MHRIGNSIDIHRLVKGEYINIGGVKIPSRYSSFSYSDGDALLHAVAESIIGALGEGDLGKHFPDNDPKYKNVESKYFIEETLKMMVSRSFHIENVDIMIVLEKPKLSEYKEKVINNLSLLLNIKKEQINLKAGTNEGIGKIGKSKSYLVWVSTLLEED